MKVSEYLWPEWAIWVQAFGPIILSVATFLVAGAVGFVAYRQLRTAKDKFIFDLFDRRNMVYRDALEAVFEVMANGGDPEGRAMWAARPAIDRGEFLFGSDVRDRLGHLAFLIKMTSKLETRPGVEEDEDLAQAQIDAVEAIINMQNEFPSLFRPYMKMDKTT